MGLDLDDGRLDPCLLKDLAQLFEVYV